MDPANTTHAQLNPNKARGYGQQPSDPQNLVLSVQFLEILHPLLVANRSVYAGHIWRGWFCAIMNLLANPPKYLQGMHDPMPLDITNISILFEPHRSQKNCLHVFRLTCYNHMTTQSPTLLGGFLAFAAMGPACRRRVQIQRRLDFVGPGNVRGCRTSKK